MDTKAPRSAIRPGTKYQAHSKGPTLACHGYDLLMELYPRITNRDPIPTDFFLSLFEKVRDDAPKKEDLLAFQSWMKDLGVKPSTVQKNFKTVCPPYLCGDCLPLRQGQFCKHGHPQMDRGIVPLSHANVMKNGECIYLDRSNGHVMVAPILSYNSRTRGLFPGLELDEPWDDGPKSCVKGSACQFRERCIYFHTEAEKATWM